MFLWDIWEEGKNFLDKEFDSILCIDNQYLQEYFACTYLIKEKNRALFIDNGTNSNIPILLDTLKKIGYKNEEVEFLIITHIHLDHAGATSKLIEFFPNAKILAHPKAAPHLINPKRIIEGASAVYGKENFYKMYGELKEIPESRIQIMKDEEEISFGERKLKFMYTKGHANHHFVIQDSKTNSIFTGDSFGVSYPIMREGKNFIITPSTTPTDFDSNEAILSIEKILKTKSTRAYLTHFNYFENLESGGEELIKGLKKMQNILDKLIELELKNEEQKLFTEKEIRNYYKIEIEKKKMNPKILDFLEDDIIINAQGINFVANRILRKKN